jgi:hypothetical protein
MNRTLTIPLYMRAILLSEICRRIDIIAYCNRGMGLKLKATREKVGERCRTMIYSGTCPFCREKERFFFHRETGYCVCESCGKIADFFDMVAIENHGDPDKGMMMLVDYLRRGEKTGASKGGAI